MDVLITDVTEMGGGNYCVAGWDVAAKRMVRPLPAGGNWSASLLGRHAITVGKLVRVKPQGTSNGVFPHRTEDTPIDQNSISASNQVFSEWLGASAPRVDASLASAFGGHLQWKSEWNGVKQSVHVLPNVDCRSLVAILVQKSNIVFYEAFEKLRATLVDGADSYELTVSSKVLKEAWRAGRLEAVNRALPKRKELHVRVGLARPFQNPPKCFAMLNGVL